MNAIARGRGTIQNQLQRANTLNIIINKIKVR
jgi:hypothetical protein